uniref:Sec-independent protein translocase protein TatA n=1 Tax=Thermosporothrix sp. COM3 TaxID=2490863 RepID=A0A455SPG2_9CHLR|nr:hypothetical protein KTC_38120 [Thermosporothrix sp. COM3]
MPIGFHPSQLLILFLLALLFFGPKRLPEMGSAIGRTIKEFKKSVEGIGNSSSSKDEEEYVEPKTAPAPEKALNPASMSLDELEREIAARKAALAAKEAAQSEVKVAPESEKKEVTRDGKVS